MPASQHSFFYRPDALPAAKPTASKQEKSLNSLVLSSPTATLVNQLAHTQAKPT